MYEYVALSWRTLAWCDDKSFVPSYAQLREEGWEEYIRAYFHNDIGGACIMRRPKDEPRKWTEAEIKKIAALVMDCRVPVLNERAMQADLCGRLEKRNAELQSAIDEVVGMERDPGFRDDTFMSRAVREYLRPLATQKEETNG